MARFLLHRHRPALRLVAIAERRVQKESSTRGCGMTDDEIDRMFPHQVILPPTCYSGALFRAIHAFCLGLSLAERGHVVLRNDEWHYVFCFSERIDADK